MQKAVDKCFWLAHQPKITGDHPCRDDGIASERHCNHQRPVTTNTNLQRPLCCMLATMVQARALELGRTRQLVHEYKHDEVATPAPTPRA